MRLTEAPIYPEQSNGTGGPVRGDGNGKPAAKENVDEMVERGLGEGLFEATERDVEVQLENLEMLPEEKEALNILLSTGAKGVITIVDNCTGEVAVERLIGSK